MKNGRELLLTITDTKNSMEIEEIKQVIQRIDV